MHRRSKETVDVGVLYERYYIWHMIKKDVYNRTGTSSVNYRLSTLQRLINLIATLPDQYT